jgi:hypothetical protein
MSNLLGRDLVILGEGMGPARAFSAAMVTLWKGSSIDSELQLD